ncbi:MAG TPA: hypothetical protein VMF66_05490 [Candidatus Acidoferrum sp.]|nr:hypothetical protein [Candidatus Acidoferrum sp.]
MRNAKTCTCRTFLMCGAALAVTFVPARAWSQQDQGTQYQNQNDNQNQNYQNPNDDAVTRQETANLDQFLDNHPPIKKDLTSNPSLCNDANYLKSHPDLQDFLNRNPRIKSELQVNASLVVRRDNRLDGNGADRDRAPGQNPNPDLNEREVGRIDQFLDDHPKIEKELQKNPSLINDRGFLRHNRDLDMFLNEHPQIHQEFAENPSYFTQRENQFGGSAANRDQAMGRNPNPDVSEREVGKMDQFLDDHPDIKKQLDKNPSLISDNGYVRHHKDLDALLAENRGLRTAFAEHSAYFIQQENRFEGADDRDRMRPSPNTASTVLANPNVNANANVNANGNARADVNPNANVNANVNINVSGEEVAKMDQFLDDHPDIEKQLDKNPSLINNDKYVRHHKALDALLAENRGLRTAFADNPPYFIHRENQFEDRNVAEMHRFLEKHKTIAKDLDKDPWRANDNRYLSHHKDLRSFFDDHAQCRTEFAENPPHFMQREHDFDLHNDHRLENHRLDQDRNKNLEHRADTDQRNQL